MPETVKHALEVKSVDLNILKKDAISGLERGSDFVAVSSMVALRWRGAEDVIEEILRGLLPAERNYYWNAVKEVSAYVDGI